jgi:hypothetical protein
VLPVTLGFLDEWLRYQQVISLETQVGITSQRNKWANTDPQTYRRWDQDHQVRKRSKHPLSTGHTRHEPSFIIMNAESIIRIFISYRYWMSSMLKVEIIML